MNFSTYALMPQGLTLVFLTVVAISTLTWGVAKMKQRRMERLLAEMEAAPTRVEQPLAASAEPPAAARVASRGRQAE